MTVDVAVVGGGPAGAAAALALRCHRPALAVAVVERGAFGRDRVGETLPPHVAPLLRRLGVWEGFRRQRFAPSAGTSAAWGDATPHVNDYLYGRNGPGWHLDRAAFDRWLAAEAGAAGATLLPGHRLSNAVRTPDGWALALDGDHPALSARFVVDATGRAAAFARRQGAVRERVDALVGVYRFFRGPAEAAHTLVEATPGGWWYSAALPGGRAVAACMTDADLARRDGLRFSDCWEGRLADAPHTAARLEELVPEGPPRVAPAQTQALLPCVGGGWLAVGDAAATVDPLSSLGLLMGLRTGLLAAYAIGDHLDGEGRALGQFARLVAAEHRAALRKRAETYAEEGRWPDALFWSRRRTATASLAA